jgi:VanZ family protein
LAANNHSAGVTVWRLATLAWAGEIFFLSTASFSGHHSRSLLAGLLNLLHLTVPEDTLDLLNTISRKSGHLSEYAILCFLIFRSFEGTGVRCWHPRQAAWSIAVAGAYSLTDEFHQSFVPGRHSSIFDCGTDTTGAAIAMLAVYVFSRFSGTNLGSPQKRLTPQPLTPGEQTSLAHNSHGPRTESH